MKIKMQFWKINKFCEKKNSEFFFAERNNEFFFLTLFVIHYLGFNLFNKASWDDAKIHPLELLLGGVFSS